MSLSDGISGLNSNQFTFTYGEANDLLSDCTRAPLMVFNDFSGADATDNSSVARSTEYKEAPAALTSEVNMDGQTKDECVSVELLSAMKEVATEHID